MLRNNRISILLMIFAIFFCISALGAVSAANPPYAVLSGNLT